MLNSKQRIESRDDRLSRVANRVQPVLKWPNLRKEWVGDDFAAHIHLRLDSRKITSQDPREFCAAFYPCVSASEPLSFNEGVGWIDVDFEVTPSVIENDWDDDSVFVGVGHVTKAS